MLHREDPRLKNCKLFFKRKKKKRKEKKLLLCATNRLTLVHCVNFRVLRSQSFAQVVSVPLLAHQEINCCVIRFRTLTRSLRSRFSTFFVMCGVRSPREQRLPFPVCGVAHHMRNDWIQLVAYVTAPIYTLSGSNMHRRVGAEVVALLTWWATSQ